MHDITQWVRTLMGDTSATCLPAAQSYTRTSPWVLPTQMKSPRDVAPNLQASAQPPFALQPGTCSHPRPYMLCAADAYVSPVN